MLVVALGLFSALSWGAGDFGAGFLGRRVPVAGVLLGSQLAGAVLAAFIAVGLGEPLPSIADLGWAVVSSVFSGFGLACLYIGLSRGRMGVVAPMAGVLVAAIPAVAGIALEGGLPTSVLAGIGLAISSVVVVSRVGATEDGRPSGLAWGLAAGLGLGVVTITLAQMAPGDVFGPLAAMRFGEGFLIAIVAVAAGVVGGVDGVADALGATRRGSIAIAIPARLWPAVAVIGALDMLGTGAYIAATQAGPLAIAGVLSALYPVTTVVLAMTVLREPLARWHLVGIVIAAAAIVLITTGSTG